MYYYFSDLEGYKVFTNSRDETSERNLQFDILKDDISKLEEFISKNQVEYVLNAIGIINAHCRDNDMEGVKKAILINSYFPFKLAEIAKKNHIKIIQIATDCVYDGKDGKYTEDSIHNPIDVYGKTKSLGEVGDGILHIRCSIIGPEKKTKLSFLEWFLNNKENELNGFLHHKWNGVTTLRFAKLMQQIIEKNMFDDLVKKSHVYHYVPKYILNKNEMLLAFNKVFNKNFKINPTDSI